MVRLKNIVLKSGNVECDFLPEDSQEAGRLVVDIQRKEVMSFTIPDGYEWCENHVLHAVNYLCNISPSNMPNEKCIMWHQDMATPLEVT